MWLFISMPFGKVVFNSSIASSKRSVSFKVLTSGCLEIVNITAGTAFNDPSPILSEAPILTVATSLILIVLPFSCFNTASFKSSIA